MSQHITDMPHKPAIKTHGPAAGEAEDGSAVAARQFHHVAQHGPMIAAASPKVAEALGIRAPRDNTNAYVQSRQVRRPLAAEGEEPEMGAYGEEMAPPPLPKRQYVQNTDSGTDTTHANALHRSSGPVSLQRPQQAQAGSLINKQKLLQPRPRMPNRDGGSARRSGSSLFSGRRRFTGRI